MSLCDDKRFILSHIRHSFITCDDTGMCETVMLNESANRYPVESIYQHFDYYSDDDDEYFNNNDDDDDDDNTINNNNNLNDHHPNQQQNNEIELLKKTELEYQSELVDDDQQQPTHSLDIMYDSYEIGIRRRSNTAQKLEKLKKERKVQSKTKLVQWKGMAPIVSTDEHDDDLIKIKRIVLDAEQLPREERDLLEFDPKENVYYETEAYRAFLFPKKEIESSEQTPTDEIFKDLSSKPRRKSMLTQQIEQTPVAPMNPFNEFTRFDGRFVDSTVSTKRLRIFFNILKNNTEFEPYDFREKFPQSLSGLNCGSNWIEVIVRSDARVCDLIGLICWHYTHLQIGPSLKPNLKAYALKMCEENGEVEDEFPNLEFNDEIKRYDFPCLAMIPNETRIIVTVHIDSEDVFSQFVFDSTKTQLNEIIEQIKKRRPHLFRSRNVVDCQLELCSQPGISLDLDSTISRYLGKHYPHNQSINFSLKFWENCAKSDSAKSSDTLTIKEKSSSLPKGISGLRLNKSSSALHNLDTNSNAATLKPKKIRDPNDFGSNFIDIMKAPLYQCFDVNLITKFTNSPIEMGISETKLEITPKMNNPSSHFTGKFLSRILGVKARNINIEDVVDCELHKQVALGRHIFKIVCWNGKMFIELKFEADSNTVDEIVFKLKNVMKLRTSLRRNEYQMYKNRKKNISTKVYFNSRLISSGSSESGSEDLMTDMDIVSAALSSNSNDDIIINNASNTSQNIRSSKFRRFRSSKKNF